MRNLYYKYSLVIIFLYGGCGRIGVTNDADCLKTINTIISKELARNHDNFDSIKEDLKIIMKFYIRENGMADSIIILKSNLYEKGIEQSLIISNLVKKRYKCIREVYYGQEPEPDNVTIVFNPKLYK